MKFKEKLLEDYLEQHPEVLANMYLQLGADSLEVECIGRQVKCEGGIIDLMFSVTHHNEFSTNPRTIVILELKGVPAKRQDREQVDRYVSTVVDAIYQATDVSNGLSRLNVVADYASQWVQGYIVAPGGNTDIDVQLVGNTFEFRWAKHKKPSFDNEKLAMLVKPIADDNIDLHLGMEIGRQMAEAVTNTPKPMVWRN